MRRLVLVMLLLMTAIPAVAQDAGWIGVTVDDQKDRGAIIRRIDPNGPAAKAGLKEGDVILEFNTQDIVGVLQLSRLVRETSSVNVVLTHEPETLRFNAQVWPELLSVPRTSLFKFKEACAKALGTGIWRHGIAWSDIEVARSEHGAPSLYLHHAAQRRAAILGWASWSVSLSHDRERAIAFVVAMSDLTHPATHVSP